MQGYKAWSDRHLKYQIYRRLCHGVVPFENWASVFAARELESWRAIQAKAFCVWFPTMLDYLVHEADFGKLRAEAQRRSLECEEVLEVLGLADALSSCYKRVLGLYSREEQVFLWDRRVQLVHGNVYFGEGHFQRVHWYDASNDRTVSEKLSPDQYRETLGCLAPDFLARGVEMLDRFQCSVEFRDLLDLFVNRLEVRRRHDLGMRLGVAGELHVDPSA